jgi:DNA-binding transcriptional ArsR family regulator
MPSTAEETLRQALPNPEIFRALGEATRGELLCQLACCGDSMTLNQLAACCKVDLSGVSRHLAAMQAAGLIKAEKRGREKFFTLQARDLASALRSLADALEACPCQCGADTKGGG